MKLKTTSSLQKKHKFSGLDKYVIFCFASVIIYTITEQYLSLKTGVERSTLTTCFYGLFGGEFVSMALIKIFKLKGIKEEIQNGEENDSDSGGNKGSVG